MIGRSERKAAAASHYTFCTLTIFFSKNENRARGKTITNNIRNSLWSDVLTLNKVVYKRTINITIIIVIISLNALANFGQGYIKAACTEFQQHTTDDLRDMCLTEKGETLKQ
uniref:Uncharacterized protein n=1 Tax=Glossina brevipalpis TaxID=37001 RepID=A0A1A9X1E8_9MUSC